MSNIEDLGLPIMQAEIPPENFIDEFFLAELDKALASLCDRYQLISDYFSIQSGFVSSAGRDFYYYRYSQKLSSHDATRLAIDTNEQEMLTILEAIAVERTL